MSVVLKYGTSYASSVTLYAESISVNMVGNNRQIPIRDTAIARTKYPKVINLGYSGPTIKLEGYVDSTNYAKLITLLPDTILQTTGSSNYAQFGTSTRYWEVKALETKALAGTSNYHSYSLTIVEQHYISSRT